MPVDFSMRQLLACLNISVFDPVMEPALKKVCSPETEAKTGTDNPFYNAPAFIGMICAALICFYGLRPYPFGVGLPLFAVCGAIMRKTVSRTMLFFLRTYFISAVLLLTEACFRISPAGVSALLFVLLTISIFRPAEQWQRILFSSLFFASVCFVFHDALAIPSGVFFLLGSAGLLFPVKNVYGREPAFVFVLFPLLLLLAKEIFALRETAVSSGGSLEMSIVFASGLLLLFAGLYRDLELDEIFWFLAGTVVLFVCGLFLSAGMEGGVVLFLMAFFTNFVALGRAAAVVFACFFVLFFLSLPVSLFLAGMISLTVGIFFGLFYFRLRKMTLEER